jgi:uncharacterized protein YdaU (DUF1376 family)
MMSKKLAWFPLFPQDFMGDPKVQLLDATTVGAYFLLLCCQWLEGGLPDDDAKLASWSKSGERWPEIRDDVLQFFDKTAGGYVNARLEEIRAEQQERHSALSEGGRKGAAVRERRRREKHDQQDTAEDDLSTTLDRDPDDGGNGSDRRPETKKRTRKGDQYDAWS